MKKIVLIVAIFISSHISCLFAQSSLLLDGNNTDLEGTYWVENIDSVDIESHTYVYQQNDVGYIKGWGEIKLSKDQKDFLSKFWKIAFEESSSITVADMKGPNGTKRTKTSPEGIKKIADRQFYDGMVFTSITFPEHLESIGDYNFRWLYLETSKQP